MERGREGRRGGGGGGLVHAPRRPRTGFKDAAGAVPWLFLGRFVWVVDKS
jgi:hypothetical protein